MAEIVRELGDLINIVDCRNTDGAITNLKGISTDKCYIPSVANTVGTNLNNYKVIKQGQFACSLMQVSRDQRIPIAMYDEEEPAIMSPAYTIFEVLRPNETLPEFIDLWFKRTSFDREASFYAVGGVRGSLDWEDFCKMKLPILPINKQREIVSRYNSVINNIKDNNRSIKRLQRLAEYLYKKSIIGTTEEKTIKEISSRVITGKTPSTEKDELWGETVPFVTIPDLHGNTFIEETGRSLSDLGSKTQKTTIVPEGSIIVSCIATVGLVSISTRKCHTNQQINSIIPKNNNDKYFIYESLLNNTQELKSLGEGGSATLNVSKSKFENFKIKYPSDNIMKKFSKTCEPIFRTIHALEDENRCLIAMSKAMIHNIKRISQEES